MNYPILPCGDCAATIQVGSQISLETHHTVALVIKTLEAARIPGIVEFVPSYASVCLYYDPLILDYRRLANEIKELPILEETQGVFSSQTRKEIPVCYGGEYGPDLAFVAQHCGLTPEEVVDRHVNSQYLVYMLGFLPGFAYLGGMDEQIACPRLAVPRTKIPAGSVGIAGGQTGIYPLNSPGGWQLIGRTPLRLFAPERETGQFFLSAGDWICFVPISAEEYRRMEEQA